ncbi:probable high-affinity zinc uptake system atp-binding abc transporter protein [Fulvimarina pelagi HTCC2506]|uniref:Zinc ABC transporter ATP-binding protein n=2 Tax=Fulvimarina pelagi TaxID=217511 RepID=A0A0N7KYY6_9HYPH|nr:ATP-binding cassette domain-containing protein [Fulvimarina pelagi]EAU42056.1 probable high-affinity zinc uptake system atp-binding abc transporter protein [Fulvimarina pelagi HTCC2506]BAT31025.1 zinc ABC transporter ATP-binding protein [Fulvimarina pelagi]
MLQRPDALVTLDNAGIHRGGRWLVRGISMSVDAGEIVTLIGPNGSGKSTTARMALGLIAPDEGTASRRRAIRVAYVPQKLTVDWTLPLKVSQFMHLTGRVGADEAQAALAATDATRLTHAEVRTLSGGEFQRVMLARAMARRPDLLVLDEPVQGVDFTGEIALYELIGRIRDELGCGVLLISHDLHVVMAATDRVFCLNGHVCCSGTPKSVALSPEYRALFGNRAASTLAVYEHDHDHTHLADGRVRHADGSITDHCHPDDGHHHEEPDKERSDA